MTELDNMNKAAADIVRARKLIGPNGQELCTMLRRLIAGLLPEQADQALVAFFHEIEVCDEVILESCGFRKLADGETPDECPF
jgi:hypothetical protein